MHVEPHQNPHGVLAEIPHPTGFFKVNSPPQWGWGPYAPWGPHGGKGVGENPKPNGLRSSNPQSCTQPALRTRKYANIFTKNKQAPRHRVFLICRGYF